MRKFFQLAAVAALVMPILVSCNPNDPNNPKKPNTPEGVLEYWTQPREDAALPVTVENMAGYWMLAYEATVDQGKNYATYSYDGNLLDLMDPVHSDLFAPRIVDNKAFPPDFATTIGACPHANDCRRCGRCAEVLSRVFV